MFFLVGTDRRAVRPSQDRRHDCVENFMHNCDTYTIETEAPVWMERDEIDFLATKNTKNYEKGSSVAATDGRGKGRANSPSEPLSRNKLFLAETQS